MIPVIHDRLLLCQTFFCKEARSWGNSTNKEDENMYKRAILVAALIAFASAAQGTGLANARQAVVLECATVSPPSGGPIPPPVPMPPTPEVIAVSATPDAPAISIGDPCGVAIGALMNSRFMLLSATPTSPTITADIGLPPPMNVLDVSSVQYLFVSKPGMGNR